MKNNKMKVSIICGGSSEERKISLLSGSACFNSLKPFFNNISLNIIQEESDLVDLCKDYYKTQDCIFFNALHGGLGENGSVQGLMDCFDIPYTHSNVYASALACDKYRTFLVLKDKIKCVPTTIMGTSSPQEFPCVIKPRYGGSSCQMFYCGSQKEWDLHKSRIMPMKDMIYQKYIDGTEFTVSIINDKSATVTRINYIGNIFDYDLKYHASSPVSLITGSKSCSKDMYQFLFRLAERIHIYVGCTFLSRLDFILEKKTGEVYFLEINTQPGMTAKSITPIQARYIGLSLGDVCYSLVKRACLK